MSCRPAWRMNMATRTINAGTKRADTARLATAESTCAEIKRADTARLATSARLAITVLRGGPSREREVSLHSGEEIAVALESLGHDVHRMDIRPENLSALEQEADAVFIALHGQFGEDGA